MPQGYLSRFCGHEGGNTAIVFALSLIPIVFAAGSALDYTRAADLRTKLQVATDATLLNLCQANTGLSVDDLHNMAKKAVAAFIPNATADRPIVTSDPRKITLTARATYETTFARVSGFTTMDLSATGGCSAEERFFEIALALDTTGSMAASSGSMSKIDALKKAASDFIDFTATYPTLKGRTKVALVPFSAAVAVDPTTYRNAAWIDQSGKSSLHWANLDPAGTGFKSRLDAFTKLRGAYLGWDWAGCFESLPYPANTQDGKPDPLVSNDSLYVPMFAPDEAGSGGSTSHTETSSGKTQYTANSYISDKNGLAGCDTNPPDDKTRMRRGCKYLSPQGATTSSGRGPNYMCRSRPLTRLTDSTTKLKSEIGFLDANGNTNIHEGLLWGWRTLSPNSVFGDGVSYTQKNTTKVLILMTDGMNTWGSASNTVLKSIYSAYGYWTNADGSTPNGRLPPANANPANDAQARAAMDALVRETCANAGKKVLIYTIGFSVATDPIDQQGLKLLSDCAGASDRAIVANDADGLIKAFQKIAKSIGTLRLTQ
jgi:Flp pilus assembly protein TadG